MRCIWGREEHIGNFYTTPLKHFPNRWFPNRLLSKPPEYQGNKAMKDQIIKVKRFPALPLKNILPNVLENRELFYFILLANDRIVMQCEFKMFSAFFEHA